jgi:tRNA pseudouridine32 synthase/23S rRNA pseudouridine746 synthase
MRDGVCASRVAVSAGPEVRVVDFLAMRLPRVTDWPQRMARGEVLDADGRPIGQAETCRRGAVLWYWRDPGPEPAVAGELDILHHDDRLVAVDKPHGLSVTPGGRWLHQTALVKVRRQLGLATLSPVHRLDLETAGVLLFTVRPDDRDAYHRHLREQRMRKVYEAVVPWCDSLDAAAPIEARHRLREREGDDFMQMEVIEGEPNATTRIELITRLSDLAHLRLHPLTGRKHQLRAQLNALGLPIVGDRIYPDLLPMADPVTGADGRLPLQLLAREIAFDDPLTGEPRRFVSRRVLAAVDGGLRAAS